MVVMAAAEVMDSSWWWRAMEVVDVVEFCFGFLSWSLIFVDGG